MGKNLVVFFTLTLALGMMIVDAPCVKAQEAGSMEEFTLEEITVTAQKREENVQDVAVTMETISGYELNEMGKTSLDDILNNVAGAWVTSSGVMFTVSMRGMDNDEGARSSFAMTAVNVDGIYSNNREVGSVGIYDLQRVEVIVGPQGTLYGRNASGGVINFITNDPNLESFEGSGTVGIGDYDLLTMTGTMNAPINDKLGLRIAFKSDSREGYASNGMNDNDTKETRVKFLYKPNETLNMLLTYEFMKMHGHGKTGYDQVFEDQDDVDNPWTNTTPLENWRLHRHTHKANLKLDWTTSVGSVTFQPSILDQTAPYDMQSMNQIDSDTGETISVGAVQSQDTKERSAELRLASLDSLSWKYMLGTYYYFRGTYSERPAQGQVQLQENDNISAFGQITYPLFDRFRVIAGGRYTADDEWFEDEVDPNNLRPGQEAHTEETYSSSNFDYKMGAEYDMGENIMLWADISTGYKHVVRGGDPQDLITYQLGAKSRFLDQRLQVNSTAFYNDYSNFSVVTSKSYWTDDGTGTLTEYEDSGRGDGEARTYGLDLSANYLLTDKDRIDLQASFLHTEISRLHLIYDYWYPPSDEYVGLKMNNSPKLTTTIGYEHTFYMSEGGNVSAKVNTRYQTETQLTFFLDENTVPEGMDAEKVNHQPAYTSSEVSLTYNDASNRWSLNSYVKNIENNAVKRGYSMGMIHLGEPRTYGVVLSVRF